MRPERPQAPAMHGQYAHLVRQEVLPVLRLDIELVHGLPAIDVARGPHSHDVCVLREHLARDGAAVLVVAVLRPCRSFA